MPTLETVPNVESLSGAARFGFSVAVIACDGDESDYLLMLNREIQKRDEGARVEAEWDAHIDERQREHDAWLDSLEESRGDSFFSEV